MNREDKLRIADTINDSIVDGPGIRLTIFVQGCPHNCEGCHNPGTHDFNGGRDVTMGEMLDKAAANPLLDGVTFSGGEPFCQAARLAWLGEEFRKTGLNIVTYSGYTFEQLLEGATPENGWRELLEVTDLLVDGPFVKHLRDLTLKFRGSSNQRIIDVKKSLECGEAVTVNI